MCSTGQLRLLHFVRHTVLGLLWAWLSGSVVMADHGQPLAVRFWPAGVVSIETQWGFEVVVQTQPASPMPEALRDADLSVSFDKQQLEWTHYPTLVSASGGQPITEHNGSCQLDHFLDRLPNHASSTLVAASAATFVSPNAVHLVCRSGSLLVLKADGVRLAILLPNPNADGESQDTPIPPAIDGLLLPGAMTMNAEQRDFAAALLQRIRPRWIVLPQAAKSLSEFQPGDADVSRTERGNTLAISAASQDDTTNWIFLQQAPWTMPAELSRLFGEKETACIQSQKVFAPLSIKQMNFKPGNGTHTPRWNAEHMMGRELLFFSQIYAKQDKAIRPIDLNPQQMPADYTAAHADWDGGEEARQMQRVAAFSRRFAYLLADLDLDQKAPGSFWTPRGLLVQMHKHYEDHTANVSKKFELPQWPKE